MMAALALLLSGRVRRSPWLRTWAALFLASAVTPLFPFASSYVFIDGIAAAIVLRHPAGLAQRAIGRVFALMMLLDLGYYFSPQNSPDRFVDYMTWLGWLQFAFLIAWGGYDAWGHRFRGAGARGHSLAAERA